MKIVLINHTFQKPEFYKRWKLLAQDHKDLEVILFAPQEWAWGKEKDLTYGHVDVLKGSILKEDNFEIRLIKIESTRFGGWNSEEMMSQIRDIMPDIVYYIGEHTQDALMQLLELKKDKATKNIKVFAFSMRGHQQSIKLVKSKNPVRLAKNVGKYFYFKKKVAKLNKYCDAVFCHYPDALSEFRKEGYKGPIFMQTQVGVDPDVFYPDSAKREKIREKYNVGDAFLFGSASRFHYSKGLSEIIEALPQDGNWKYLMMGWGRDDEVEKIKNEIKARGLEDKIILTGFINNWTDMCEHWNALDCAVHMPLTTPEWEETFSLALVQAMITGLPVMASSSGSVPYQVGEEGIIIEERNIEKMRATFEKMIADREYGQEIGQKMRKRALNSFSIYHLNDCFYDTIVDLMKGIYDENKIDMAKYRVGEDK